MKQFVITLTTLSPLTIRSDQAQGGSETAQYISGATLLGSLASAHRFMHPDWTDEFARLFLHDAVQYPNLYPAPHFHAEENDEDAVAGLAVGAGDLRVQLYLHVGGRGELGDQVGRHAGGQGVAADHDGHLLGVPG